MTTLIRPFASDNQITVAVADTALIRVTIAPVVGQGSQTLTFNDNEAAALIEAIHSAVAASFEDEADDVLEVRDFDRVLR